LTLPQVAATLAATLVSYNTLNAAGERLLPEEIFNAVLVLLVVTSLLGPILTDLSTPGVDQGGTHKTCGGLRLLHALSPLLARNCQS
jgi:hypothetical protein